MYKGCQANDLKVKEKRRRKKKWGRRDGFIYN